MIDAIVKTILVEMPMNSQEMIEFKELLKIVAVAAQKVNLEISEERWLSMGVHLLAVLRRRKNGEKLPVVDSFIVEQVSSEMMELSRNILQQIKTNRGDSSDDTEAVLLALHFETAKTSN